MPHFEIHVADIEAAKACHAGLFGWTFSQMPAVEDIDDHLIADPGFGGDAGVTGGLIRPPDATPAAGGSVRGCTMAFKVADCDTRHARALAHGGAEAPPPTEYSGIGLAAYVEDGQRITVGMIAPAKGDM